MRFKRGSIRGDQRQASCLTARYTLDDDWKSLHRWPHFTTNKTLHHRPTIVGSCRLLCPVTFYRGLIKGIAAINPKSDISRRVKIWLFPGDAPGIQRAQKMRDGN